jgi:hypothetical protein
MSSSYCLPGSHGNIESQRPVLFFTEPSGRYTETEQTCVDVLQLRGEITEVQEVCALQHSKLGVPTL